MHSKRRDKAKEVAVGSSKRSTRLIWRTFSGPRGAEAALRVAIERAAYAELIAHAKGYLDSEICGVLVGQFCEDDEGGFVHVEAIIAGNAAVGGATHVTFTQDTWDAIHASLERDYPKSRIVGWYHSHPGFGVEFSDMDLFIQENFFPGELQIALVIDPMSGAVAIAANIRGGIEYLPRFWVDAREHVAMVPSRVCAAGEKIECGSEMAGAEFATKVSDLEKRVGQLIQAHDSLQTLFQRSIYIVGFVVCLLAMVCAGYFIYSQYWSAVEPPRLANYVPVPVQVGDKSVLVGVGVVQWDVPPEINALLRQTEKDKHKTEGKPGAPDEMTETGPESSTPGTTTGPDIAPTPDPKP